MRAVETVLFLVVVATVVATFANRLRIPAPSLLVVAGVVVGLLPGVPGIAVTPEVVSLVVLPPLLFAAGEELPWRDLRVVAVTPLSVGMSFVLGAFPRQDSVNTRSWPSAWRQRTLPSRCAAPNFACTVLEVRARCVR